MTLLATVTLEAIMRRVDRWAGLALVGLVVLLTFVAIRAASFHYVDALIGKRYIGVRVNHLLELGGISIIAVAALGARRAGRSTARMRRGLRRRAG